MGIDTRFLSFRIELLILDLMSLNTSRRICVPSFSQKRKKKKKKDCSGNQKIDTRSVSEKSKARLVIYVFNRIAIARDRFSLHLSFCTPDSLSTFIRSYRGEQRSCPLSRDEAGSDRCQPPFFALLRSDCSLSPSGIAILQLVSHHHICLINPANTIWLERVICFNSFNSVAFARLPFVCYSLSLARVRDSEVLLSETRLQTRILMLSIKLI